LQPSNHLELHLPTQVGSFPARKMPTLAVHERKSRVYPVLKLYIKLS